MEGSSRAEMISEEEASRLRLEALWLFERRQREVTLRTSRVGIHPNGLTPASRSAFFTILKRYNSAIADNLTKLHRHEASLRAWSSVLEEIEMPQEVMRPLFWDHVEPVLFMALDLSSAIKEQVMRAAVLLKELADGGVASLAEVTKWEGDRSHSWIKDFNALDDESCEFRALKKRG